MSDLTQLEELLSGVCAEDASPQLCEQTDPVIQQLQRQVEQLMDLCEQQNQAYRELTEQNEHLMEIIESDPTNRQMAICDELNPFMDALTAKNQFGESVIKFEASCDKVSAAFQFHLQNIGALMGREEGRTVESEGMLH